MKAQAPCIFVTEDYPQWALTLLRTELPNYNVVQGSLVTLFDNQELCSCVEALLVRSTSTVDHKLLNFTPQLKAVGTATSGFDHLDLKALKEKNIVAFHTPDANADSTADLTLWHILSVSRFLNTSQLKKAQWRSDLPRGKNLHSLSLGVLGMGRIGRRVAQRAQAFGMSIFYHDPYIEHEELGSATWNLAAAEPLGLLELFTHCDVITLHLPLTGKTRHIINEKTLEHFGNDKILVNCARGELIQTSALLKALDTGVLTHAALDTFEVEPLEALSPLREHPQVQCTPHIGAYTEQSFNRSCQEAVELLSKFLKSNQIPPSTLPPTTLWAEEL